MQLGKVEEEKHGLKGAYSELQKQMEELKVQFENNHLQNESYLQDSNDPSEVKNLKEQLCSAQATISELDSELQQVRQLWLDHISDSQANASELRSDLEQTRKQLLSENGVQRAERLRAHQDLVNRIIQMGEKNKEVEMNVKKLQAEDKHITADMTSLIQKLGDPEQQELVQGTLKALELENQVLNLRNMQLEKCNIGLNKGPFESLKNEDGNKLGLLDSTDTNIKFSDIGVLKQEDDIDNLSFHSEFSDVSVQKQKLEAQVAHLQNQIDLLKRDINHHETVRSAWSQEKRDLECQLDTLRERLHDKEDTLALVTAQKGLLTVKSSEDKKQCEGEHDNVLKMRLDEANSTISKFFNEREKLLLEKNCLASELEAMAKVVQDLESKLANREEECAALRCNMEELDEQHQNAIEKLLALKSTMQLEKDALQMKVDELLGRPEVRDCETQASCVTSVKAAQVDSVVEITSKAIQAINEDDNIGQTYEEFVVKYEEDLYARIMSSLHFDVPSTPTQSSETRVLDLIKSLIKLCEESKWKKDTLERKITELMKECREKQSLVQSLESQCENLRAVMKNLTDELNAEREKETLPTIAEHEEMEAMEVKMASLRGEVEVLREMRINLEADASRMRKEKDDLISKLRLMEAQQRNEENMQCEIHNLYKELADRDKEREEMVASNSGLELELDSLKKVVDNLNTTEVRLREEIAEKESALQISNQQNDALREHSSALEGQVSELEKILSEVQNSCEEKEVEVSRLRDLCLDLEKQLHTSFEMKNGFEVQIQELEQRLVNSVSQEQTECMRHELDTCLADNAQLKDRIGVLKSQLVEAKSRISDLENLELEEAKWKEIVSVAEEKSSQAFKEVSELQGEVKRFKQLLEIEAANKKEVDQKRFALQEANKDFIREIESLERALVLKEEEKVILSKKLTELCSLLSEGEVYKEELVEVKSQLNSVISEKQHFSDELAALNVELKSAQEDKEALVLETRVSKDLIEKLSTEIQKMQMSTTENKGSSSNKCNHSANGNPIKLTLVHQESVSLSGHSQEEVLPDCASVGPIFTPEMHEKSACTECDDSHSDVRVDCTHCVEGKVVNSVLGISDSFKGPQFGLINSFNERHQRMACQDSTVCSQERTGKNVVFLSDYGEKHDSISSDVRTCTVDVVRSAPSEQWLQERQMLLSELESKAKEIEFLTSEVCKLKSCVNENQRTLQQFESENKRLQEHEFQCKETCVMMKESVASLSDIIKNKDLEIVNLVQKCDSLNSALKSSELMLQESSEVKQALDRALCERDQLVQTVQIKHQECVQYHTEIQRLGSLLNREMNQHQQLLEQYHKHQKQVESEVNAEKIQEFNNLIHAKDEALQALGKAMEMKDQELQARGHELESLREQILCMSEDFAILRNKSNEATPIQDSSFQDEIMKLERTLNDEQLRNKQLQTEVEVRQAKEASVQKEVERLKQHLVEIEETYTQEVLKMEEQNKDLLSKLAQAEEVAKSSSTVLKSASIRANQQAETLQEQLRLIGQQRDDLQDKLSCAEDEIQKQTASLRNLQAVLEQFQRDKTREISAARDEVFSKVIAAEKKQQDLVAEITFLKAQLSQANEGLRAGARLGEELDKKSLTITSLRQEISELQGKMNKADDALKSANLNVEGKVDKSLVKNVVLGYFLAPPKSQPQVVHVVASVLEFTEEEKKRVQHRLGISTLESGSGGWFKNLLHPSSGSGEASNQSLSEAFVRFLENESLPQPQLRLLPDTHSTSGNSSPTATARRSSTSSQRQSPLLLTDVQLPTFAQFPVGRNSSSILKDILKES